MDGVQRAAILLMGIGEARASEVLKHLEPKQVQKVGITISTMANVSKNDIQTVVDDFLAASEQQTSLGVDSEKFIRTVLTNALGEEKATNFIDRILQTDEYDNLNTLRWLDARSIVDLIRNEHPQVIATVLTYLESEQAAQVVSFLPEDKHVDLLMRMSTIDSIKPEALTELGQMIQEQISGQKQGKNASIGGIKSVADVINYLEGGAETKVLQGIKTLDADLCEKIQEKMFVFENIYDMDGRSVQTLLRDVPTEVLMLALKGADEKVKEKIFSNMSKRAGELLRDDLEAQGPVKVSDVETAQKTILATARRLAESGEISLGGKGGEEMI